MGFDLRNYEKDRSLPAESEQFRSNVWQAISDVQLNEAGLTLGRVHAMLWELKEKQAAESLDKAMSDYCYSVAMSTSKDFDCSKQLFNECPTSMWQSICFAPDSLKQVPEFNAWEMPVSTSHLFREGLKEAAIAKCNEYGLTFNAVHQGRAVGEKK